MPVLHEVNLTIYTDYEGGPHLVNILIIMTLERHTIVI